MTSEANAWNDISLIFSESDLSLIGTTSSLIYLKASVSLDGSLPAYTGYLTLLMDYVTSTDLCAGIMMVTSDLENAVFTYY